MVLLLILFLVAAFALDDKPHSLYTWKSREKYYFRSLNEKMEDILNGDCKKSFVIAPESSYNLPQNNYSLSVSSFPPSKDLTQWWRSFPPPSQMRVEPFLCDAVYLKKTPIFNNSGCQLPHYMNPSAPRCQTKYLKWICYAASIGVEDSKPNHFILPESNHHSIDNPPVPYLLTARHSFVTMCGQIIGSCGIVHTTANCMATGYRPYATGFKRSCTPPSELQASQLNSLISVCREGTPFSQEVKYVDKVFVVAEVDDTYVYHIHLEIVPRIVYHLQFLLENPDIKILFGCDSRKDKGNTNAGLRQGLMVLKPILEMTGIPVDRLIVHSHVFANHIYLPMEGGCQDPVFNTWQILEMRKLFFDGAGLSSNFSDISSRPSHIPSSSTASTTSSTTTTSSSSSETNTPSYTASKPVMTLIKRSSRTKHTRNGHDSVRQWSDTFAQSIVAALAERFPTYHVVLFSDKNVSMMTSHASQVRHFFHTDVLIGVHGAGLANMLYMKPNSAVVELGPYGNDGRCLLGGGPFSRLAAVMSHDYMIHHPPYAEYKWMVQDVSSEFDVMRFVTHIESFLRSIGKIS